MSGLPLYAPKAKGPKPAPLKALAWRIVGQGASITGRAATRPISVVQSLSANAQNLPFQWDALLKRDVRQAARRGEALKDEFPASRGTLVQVSFVLKPGAQRLGNSKDAG